MTTNSKNADAAAGAPVAVVRQLTKRYGTQRVVDGLNMELKPGTITGFVGPNGAGKTTTIRMLLGLIRPDSGEVGIIDLARVGAVIEEPAFHPSLSARKNLQILATVGGIRPRRVAEVLDQVGLADRACDAVRTLSLGMRQRLGIAVALLPDPDLLLLDEPTNGLDPQGIRDMRALLHRLANDGAALLISSHLLSELGHLCGELVAIRKGRLMFAGPIQSIQQQQHAALIVRPDHRLHVPRLAALLRQHDYETNIEGDSVVITSVADQAGCINRLAFASGITLAELHTRQEDLETTFLRMMAEGMS